MPDDPLTTWLIIAAVLLCLAGLLHLVTGYVERLERRRERDSEFDFDRHANQAVELTKETDRWTS